MTPVLQGGQGRGIALWFWKVSQQTFWTFLDPASEILVEVERNTQRGRVGDMRRGLGVSDECPWNFTRMSDGAF